MVSAFIRNSNLLMITFILSSYTQGPSPLVSRQMQDTTKKENSLIQKAVMEKEVKSAATHQNKMQNTASSDIMIVDPKEVAKDWKSAFTMLKSKQTGNLVFNLATGENISRIVNIDAMPGGYLMLFTLKNLHGLQYKIIKTSEIVSLTAE